MTHRGLVLSLFPGVDLLGRAFEAEGWCVVQGPELMLGRDIRDFHGFPGRFDGIIGGPPCQSFSDANRNVTGQALEIGIEMIRHYLRVVDESDVTWFLMENVRNVPVIELDGYSIQRTDLTDWESGGSQLRLRHFQYGDKRGFVIRPGRVTRPGTPEPAALASEGFSDSPRAFADFCRVQGLPGPLKLPPVSPAWRYTLVGNGVPLPMGRNIARAVTAAGPSRPDDCACGCGRRVTGRATFATAACRKRAERSRKGQLPGRSQKPVTLQIGN